MAELLGYTVEELQGKNAFDLVHPDDLERAAEQWAARMQGVAGRLEFLFVRKDGSPLWTSCSATPLFDEAGHPVGAFAMVIDVTELKQAEAERSAVLAREQRGAPQAEEANRLKDEFLATRLARAAHAAQRDPRLGAAAAHRQPRRGDAAARALETIERNASAQAQIIEDMLDV